MNKKYARVDRQRTMYDNRGRWWDGWEEPVFMINRRLDNFTTPSKKDLDRKKRPGQDERKPGRHIATP
jgi:hypothetical protein